MLRERVKGQGEPVDRLDQFCRKYQRCSKCVKHDNRGLLTQENKECDWENARYEISFNATSMRLDCSESASDGACGINQCKERIKISKIYFLLKKFSKRSLLTTFWSIKKCDEELAFQLSRNFDIFNAAFQLQNFDQTENCKGEKNNRNPGEMKCCGLGNFWKNLLIKGKYLKNNKIFRNFYVQNQKDYPNRFPFHTRQGARECCGSHVFSTETHQCCDGEKVKRITMTCWPTVK